MRRKYPSIGVCWPGEKPPKTEEEKFRDGASVEDGLAGRVTMESPGGWTDWHKETHYPVGGSKDV